MIIDNLRGMGYAYLSGYLAINVFLIWRRPTPWAPSNTRVFRWNAGSPTAAEWRKIHVDWRGIQDSMQEWGVKMKMKMLTWNFDNFFIRDQIKLIEDRIVFGEIFVATLFLLPSEYRAVDCKLSEKRTLALHFNLENVQFHNSFTDGFRTS